MLKRRLTSLAIYTATAFALWLWYDRAPIPIPEEQHIYHELFLLTLFAVIFPVWTVIKSGAHLNTRARVVRLLLLSGIGVVVCDLILPESFETIISYLQYFKIITIVPTLIMEFFVAIAIYRVALAGRQSHENAQKIEQDYGVPPWLAKAFVMEANFWLRIYRFFSGTRHS